MNFVIKLNYKMDNDMIQRIIRLAKCSKCDDTVICHRKYCRGKYLDSNNNWKKLM